MAKVSSDPTVRPHERYLRVYDLIQERDGGVGRMFNDLERSTAIGKLFSIYQADLLTDNEWATFSEEIRNTFTSLYL